MLLLFDRGLREDIVAGRVNPSMLLSMFSDALRRNLNHITSPSRNVELAMRELRVVESLIREIEEELRDPYFRGSGRLFNILTVLEWYASKLRGVIRYGAGYKVLVNE